MKKDLISIKAEIGDIKASIEVLEMYKKSNSNPDNQTKSYFKEEKKSLEQRLKAFAKDYPEWVI